MTDDSTVGATSMPALVYLEPGQARVESRPVPALGPHDVLIEVDYCGVCGSDLHFMLEGWSPPNRIHGHEYSGRIVAVGEECLRWQPGTAVIGGPPSRCGSCSMCRAGRPSLCVERDTPGKTDGQGAFARYIAISEDEVHAIPAGLDTRTAALSEPLAVALHAITVSRVAPGQRALVSGAGPIGALVLAALRANGIDEVVVVEPNESRRRLAERVGATELRRPDELEVPSIAEPERIVDGSVDVVFECSGRRAAMEAGLAQLGRGGTLVIVGSGIEPPRFDPNRILLNELVITGSFNYDDHGFDHALELLASGRLPTDVLIDAADVPLDGVITAMHGLVSGDIAGKAMVRPGWQAEEGP